MVDQGVEDVTGFIRFFFVHQANIRRYQEWRADVQESKRFDLFIQFNSLHGIPTYLAMKLDRQLTYIK